jgi:hypothetical protein
MMHKCRTNRRIRILYLAFKSMDEKDVEEVVDCRGVPDDRENEVAKDV